ncbi:MAG: zinc ABC transporter substrate-binding protein [Pseudomonadota bacterium]
MIKKDRFPFCKYLFIGFMTLVLNSTALAADKTSNSTHILTSIYPLYLWVTALVHPNPNDPNNKKWTVEMLGDSGSDPHHRELRPSDWRALHEAKTLVWLGEIGEPQLSRAVTTAKINHWGALNQIKDVLPARFSHGSMPHAGESLSVLGSFEESDIDPHIWLSLRRLPAMLTSLAQHLGKARPDDNARIQSNLKNQIAILETLLSSTEQQSWGSETRGIIEYHDAFQYLLKDLGLTSAALLVSEPDQTPTPSRLREAQTVIQQQDIACILTDVMSDPSIQPLFPTTRWITADILGSTLPGGVDLLGYWEYVLGVVNECYAR